MDKSIALLALCLAGCVNQSFPPLECDEMRCSIPSERVTVQLPIGSLTPAAPIAQLVNPNGFDLIGLASSDTTGIVQLKPLRPQSFGGGNVPIYVSARAPFVGRIEGPIDVYTLHTLSGVNLNNVAQPVLDIIGYEQQPPQAPQRAQAVYRDEIVLDGSGTAAIHVYCVTGRVREILVYKSEGGHNVTATITALSHIGNAADTVRALETLDTKTVAGVTRGFAQFGLPALTSAAAVPPVGVDVIDYLGISFASGTAADTILVEIHAWD